MDFLRLSALALPVWNGRQPETFPKHEPRSGIFGRDFSQYSGSNVEMRR
jgi:hypothetical protein